MLEPAFITLNATQTPKKPFMKADNSRFIKAEVNQMFIGIITITTTITPQIPDIIAPFMPDIFLLIKYRVTIIIPDAKKCIRKPIIPLDALTVIACIKHTTKRLHRAYTGPKIAEQTRIGTSANSIS